MNGLGRLTRYLWLVSSIFLVTSIFGYLYYLETQQKEDYFNQLYFRKLAEISSGFEINLVRLMNFTGQAKNNINDLEKRLAAAKAQHSADEVQAISKYQYEYELAQNELDFYLEDTGDSTLKELLLDEIREYYQFYLGIDEIPEQKWNLFTCKDTAESSSADVLRSIKIKRGSDKRPQADKEIYCYSLNFMTELLRTLRDLMQMEPGETLWLELEKLLKHLRGVESYFPGYTMSNELLRQLDANIEPVTAISGLVEDTQGVANFDPRELADLEHKLEKSIEEFPESWMDPNLQEVRRLLSKWDCFLCKPGGATEVNDHLTAAEKAVRKASASDDGLHSVFWYQSIAAMVSETLDTLIPDLAYYRTTVEELNKSTTQMAQNGEDPKLLELELDNYFGDRGPVQKDASRHDLRPTFLQSRRCPLAPESMAVAKKAAPVEDCSVPGQCANSPQTAAGQKIATIQDRELMQQLQDACDGILFLGKAKRRSPYPGGKVAVTSFLRNVGAFETPLRRLLPADLEEFATVLVAAEDGEVLIQTTTRSDVFSHSFLNIRHLLEQAGRPEASNEKDTNNNSQSDSLSYTDYVDAQIGGVDHRIFFYPYKTSEFSLRIDEKEPKRPLLYFIGVKPKSQITANKMQINPGTSAVLLSAALAIFLAFVFLKIQLAHVDASFTRLEGSIAVTSIVVLSVVTLVGLLCLSLSAQLAEELESDARDTISELKEKFADEVEAHLNQVDQLLRNNPRLVRSLSEAQDTGNKQAATASTTSARAGSLLRSMVPPCLQKTPDGLYLTQNIPQVVHTRHPDTQNHDPQSSYPLENLFMLNSEGKLTGAIVRGTLNQVRPTRGLDLSARNYFIRAQVSDVWELKTRPNKLFATDLCKEERQPSAEQSMQGTQPHAEPAPSGAAFPLYMERIFNLGDGARNTQFSIPVVHQFSRYSAGESAKYDARSRYGYTSTEPVVISFGTTLRTFQAPLLPSGLKFAVIENSTGTVLYHSDDSRSLVENFFQETENDENLAASIRTSGLFKQQGGPVAEPIPGLYRGNETLFFVDRLHESVPWTIAVFDERGSGQSTVTILFTISLMICAGSLLVIGLLLKFLSLGNVRLLGWLWPQPRKARLYPRLGLAALFSAVVYAILLMQIGNALLLMSAVIALSFAFILVFKKIFASAQSRADSPEMSTRSFRSHYVRFLLALLVLTTATPVIVIVIKTGDELFSRARHYDTVTYRESLRLFEDATDRQLRRLCGPAANEKSKFIGCKSIFLLDINSYERLRKERNSDELEKKRDRDQKTVLEQLRNPTHALGRKDKKCDRQRIFCGSFESRESSPGRAPPGFIDVGLDLLENFWSLAGMLDALRSAQQAEPLQPRGAGMDYHLSYNSPSIVKIVGGHAWILLLVAAALLVIFGGLNFLAVKLLGIDVPRSYRSRYLALDSGNWDRYARGEIPAGTDHNDYPRLQQNLESPGAHFSILIRPAGANLAALLEKISQRVVSVVPGTQTIDTHALSVDESLRDRLMEQLANPAGERNVLVLENFESIAFDKSKRLQVLRVLEDIVSGVGCVSGASLLLVCDVAPLYMLINQSHYLPDAMSAQYADAQESVRWSRLLARFEKYYDWTPAELEFVDTDDWENTVLREVSAWPELYPLKDSLDLLRSENLSKEQAVQYVATHAGPLYRRRWSLCTEGEKLVLYQLARGHMINPENVEPLEHLMRRGFVRRDPQWSIVNDSFARFVLTAEDEKVYATWVTASEQGLWKILRVPLFTAALVILGILMYSAQEAIESFLALATGALALLPLLLRNFSMVRGAPGSSNQ